MAAVPSLLTSNLVLLSRTKVIFGFAGLSPFIELREICEDCKIYNNFLEVIVIAVKLSYHTVIHVNANIH